MQNMMWDSNSKVLYITDLEFSRYLPYMHDLVYIYFTLHVANNQPELADDILQSFYKTHKEDISQIIEFDTYFKFNFAFMVVGWWNHYRNSKEKAKISKVKKLIDWFLDVSVDFLNS